MPYYTYLNSSKYVYGQCYIDKVTFSGGCVKFQYSADRQDVDRVSDFTRGDNRLRLSKISVFNDNNLKIKEVELINNSYFEKSGEKLGFSSVKDSEKKAMKLDALNFNLFTGFPYKWEFSYDLSKTLPVLHSYQQDFWGYYNGAAGNNQYFIPKTFRIDKYGKPVIIGGNREANFEYMRAGILNRIKYPSGGYSEYIYEANQYMDKDALAGIKIQKQLFSCYAMNVPSGCEINIPDPELDRIYTITEELTSYKTANIYFNLSGYEIIGQGPMSAKIYKNGISILSALHYPNPNNHAMSTNIAICKGDVIRFELNTFGAKVGKVGAGPCGAPSIEAGISYDYNITTSEPNLPKEAGGLRINSIKTYSETGKLAMEKRYEYNTPNQINGKGIGVMLTDPYRKNIFYRDYLEMNNLGNEYNITSKINITSNMIINGGLSNGVPVFYPQVTEFIFEFNKKTTPFSTQYNFKHPFVYRDYKPGLYCRIEDANFPPWLNSKPLIESVIYNNYKNGLYSPVKIVTNKYRLVENRDLMILKLIELGPDYKKRYKVTGLGWVYDQANPRRNWAYNLYVPRAIYHLEQSDMVTYSDNAPKIKNITTYTYNSFNEIRTQQIISSDGKRIKINQVYTGDLIGNPLYIKGIYSKPILLEKTSSDNIISGIFNKYDSNSRVIESYLYENKDGGSPRTRNVIYNMPPVSYKLKSEYIYSNNKKNIQQINEKDQTISYLWSYNNQYPIAEILNASYTHIETALGGHNAIITFANKSNPSLAEIKTFLTPLSNNLNTKNALISYYTYQPLVGIISKTEPNGTTTTYEYDNLGRLICVKDHNNNVIKEYDYNYKK